MKPPSQSIFLDMTTSVKLFLHTSRNRSKIIASHPPGPLPFPLLHSSSTPHPSNSTQILSYPRVFVLSLASFSRDTTMSSMKTSLGIMVLPAPLKRAWVLYSHHNGKNDFLSTLPTKWLSYKKNLTRHFPAS